MSMFKISENAASNISQLKGIRVAVLGAARSGIAVASLLARAGAQVLLSDIKSADQLSLPMEKLAPLGIKVETGAHTEAVLQSNLICISPGMPLTIPVLQKAAKKQIPIVGEIEAASWFCRSPIIAVTGSNGKTTTTTLSGEILRQWNPETIVAGNIGQPFAEVVSGSTPNGLALLEISSFQLETIESFHPRISVIMNLTANHLDRYPDFGSYAAAKLNILKNMTGEDVLIYNGDDKYLRDAVRDSIPRKLVFRQAAHDGEGAYWENESVVIQMDGKKRTIPLKEYQLRGPHNRYNMMVAALLGILNEVPPEIISRVIAAFRGIEHRLEQVRTLRGVAFVNDSKATTVDSLGYALRSFPENIVLIAGGKDKGGDFSEVNALLRERVKLAVLIGKAADRMEKSWTGVVPLSRAASLKEAIELAFRNAASGDVVLLSPACSSFDMFQDYEDRGRQFKTIVEGLSA